MNHEPGVLIDAIGVSLTDPGSESLGLLVLKMLLCSLCPCISLSGLPLDSKSITCPKWAVKSWSTGRLCRLILICEA